MTSTQTISSSMAADSRSVGAGTGTPARSRRTYRLSTSVIGLVGAGVLAYGVSLTWLSTFAGLIAQSGLGTRNGDIMLAGAGVAAVAAVGQAFVATVPLRWLLALTGFAMAGYSGYLLIQLYTITQQLDGMLLPDKGPGLYVAAAGATIVFSTIFLPMPMSTGDPTTPPSRDSTGGRRSFSAGLFGALRSPQRYPAAALALVAGLAHVPVTPEHLDEAPYIGVLFIVLTVVCVIWAAALLISDSRAVWASLGATCLLAVAGYVVSRTIGLPLMADDVGNWFETLGVVSVVTETAVALLAALALVRRTG